VNLTPYAARLSDGQPHTISLRVFDADNYFSATASLLLYLDPGSTQITGAVTQNTLTGPSPVVKENLNVEPTSIAGTVDVTSNRSFVISGYVNTSHGKVTTTLSQTVDFFSYQNFNIIGNEYVQNIAQGTSVGAYTSVAQTGAPTVVTYSTYNFPLTVDITEDFLSNGDLNIITNAQQTYQLDTTTSQAGKITYTSSLKNAGQHVDTLELNSSFNIIGNMNQSATQQYNSFDSTGAAYDCAISAANNVLTGFSSGCAQ
jgi:hypothetical protein